MDVAPVGGSIVMCGVGVTLDSPARCPQIESELLFVLWRATWLVSSAEHALHKTAGHLRKLVDPLVFS